MDNINKYYDKAGYLFVKINTKWTRITAERAIDELKTEAIKRGYNYLLLDLREWTQIDSELTRFFTGEYLAKIMPPPFKIAAFAIPSAINKFGENTAVNRYANFRIFEDEASATRWLVENF